MTITYAVIALGALALLFGLILGYASIRFKVDADPLVDQIDEVLPQTQCGQCGYPGCRPYAEAIANGDEINKCPPGGESTIKKLADLMGVEPKPLDDAHGEEDVKKVAFIREDECIGCTCLSNQLPRRNLFISTLGYWLFAHISLHSGYCCCGTIYRNGGSQNQPYPLSPSGHFPSPHYDKLCGAWCCIIELN